MNVRLAVSCIIMFLLSCVYCENGNFYSVQFYSKNVNINFEISYQILVNSTEVASGNMRIYSSGSSWINFEVAPMDIINIVAAPTNRHCHYYFAYNVKTAANGGGFIVYNSRSNVFRPYNECTSVTCTMYISAISSVNWQGSEATFYVNDFPELVDYDGSSNESFQSGTNDIIKANFNHAGIQTEIGYSISLNVDISSPISWFYDSYGSNALIPNIITNQRSPTGGRIYIMGPDQQTSFLESMNLRKNMIWRGLTV